MFRHFLHFITLPIVGTIEIGEPIGFDKASYKVKQDDSRFGRDIVIANEETELIFTRQYFEQLNTIQTLPNGDVIDYASQGFDFLLDIFNNEGTEAEVEYIIEKDGNSFITGIFSYFTMSVQFDQIKVKIIQNTNRETIKRLEDTDIDAFNNKSLDGRTITPCVTTNILLKAKPILYLATWKGNGSTETGGASIVEGVPPNYSAVNNANVTIDYTEDSVSFISGKYATNSAGIPNDENFVYLDVKNNLTNVKIDLSNIVASSRSVKSGTISASGYVKFIVRVALDITDNSNDYVLYTKNYTNTNSSVDAFPTDLTLTIPFIQRGYRVYIYAYAYAEAVLGGGGAGLDFYSVVMSFTGMNVKITSVSTAVDTVVKGVRLCDLQQHAINSMADIPLIAPDYQLGGTHYDNFAFNGLLLGQITDKPFYNKWKDLYNIFKETCSDIQVNADSVEARHYSAFYTDNNMATFIQVPSYEATTNVNKRYSLKTAEFKYKNSAQNRETSGENTIDDVHTETQKYITDKVDGNLKVELDHIRSSFLIEEARKRAFDNKQTNSLQNDDKLFILDCVPLPPSSKGHYNGVLLTQVNDLGNLQLLNNNLAGDGINFNWTLLGFKINDTFFIESGVNIGTWKVISITSSVLELEPISGTPTAIDEYIDLSWFYTDVIYTNRTSEGFTSIAGVENPQNYSNLNYHWARNIQTWYNYLATSTKYLFNVNPLSVIKTASFKNNGNLVTRKTSESTNVVDSADIPTTNITSYKILNPVIHTVKVYASFDEITQLIEGIRDIKGYVTVNMNNGKMVKGYVKELDYVWLSEELTLDIEEKFESDYLVIDINGVKEVGYPIKNNLQSFEINNIYLSLFDTDGISMVTPTRFNKVLLDGVIYTDKILFADALQTYIDNL